MEQARQEAGPLWWIPIPFWRMVVFDWWPAQADFADVSARPYLPVPAPSHDLVRETRVRV